MGNTVSGIEKKIGGIIPYGWAIALIAWLVPFGFFFLLASPVTNDLSFREEIKLFCLLLGSMAGVCYFLFILMYTARNVIGRYEWIYVMPEDKIVIKPNYDDEAFRTSVYRLRMKVGGWFKTSRRMTTPFEGERIDHVRYDGDGDMTITLPHAKFTVPVSCAIHYLRHRHSQSHKFGTALNNLLIDSDWFSKNERELDTIHTMLGLLLDALAGKRPESNRPPMWMKQLRINVIGCLKKDLPEWSKFRRHSVMSDEDSNLDSFNGALLLRGEKPLQESPSASNS